MCSNSSSNEVLVIENPLRADKEHTSSWNCGGTLVPRDDLRLEDIHPCMIIFQVPLT